MRAIADSSNPSRFPLIDNWAKGAVLLGLVLVGRVLRDIVVPANSELGRGVYFGAVAGVLLYLMARPGITRARAAIWATLGGLATAAVMAL